MLEKIDGKDLWKKGSDCLNLEHNPPMHIVLENGTYKHTCPGCGNVIVFTVNNPVCSVL